MGSVARHDPRIAALVAELHQGWWFSASGMIHNRPFTIATVWTGPSLFCVQPVDLGRHDEVALRQAVDLVRPQCDLGFTPGKQDIGVMSLFFG
jgi:hypothetical protein